MSNVEYPKMVYKSREDYKLATDKEDHERLVKLGYGSPEVMVFGRKPKEEPKPKPVIKEPIQSIKKKKVIKRKKK